MLFFKIQIKKITFKNNHKLIKPSAVFTGQSGARYALAGPKGHLNFRPEDILWVPPDDVVACRD